MTARTAAALPATSAAARAGAARGRAASCRAWASGPSSIAHAPAARARRLGRQLAATASPRGRRARRRRWRGSCAGHQTRRRPRPDRGRRDVATLAPTGGHGLRDPGTAPGRRRAPRAVLPDLATCADCLRELFDPADRRHRYPFTNCTQLRPALQHRRGAALRPRAHSMARFPMCAACRGRVRRPGRPALPRPAERLPGVRPAAGAVGRGRRACCAARDGALRGGRRAIRAARSSRSRASAASSSWSTPRDEAAVRAAARAQAPRGEAVRRDVPVARGDRGDAARVGAGGSRAAHLARSAHRAAAPRRSGALAAARRAAATPGSARMLPYTPLHHLLLGDLGFPVVATSGNRADEPIVHRRARGARRGSRGIADLFLVHDRPIVRPRRRLGGARRRRAAACVLRRARGFARCRCRSAATARRHPRARRPPEEHGRRCRSAPASSLGQHVGDLDTARGAATPRPRAVDDLAALSRRPAAARRLRPPSRLRTRPALAERARPAGRRACSIITPTSRPAWPRTASRRRSSASPGTAPATAPTAPCGAASSCSSPRPRWRRVAHLRPFRLPGGERAVREPRRSALGLLFADLRTRRRSRWPTCARRRLHGGGARDARGMLERGVNAPLHHQRRPALRRRRRARRPPPARRPSRGRPRPSSSDGRRRRRSGDARYPFPLAADASGAPRWSSTGSPRSARSSPTPARRHAGGDRARASTRRWRDAIADGGAPRRRAAGRAHGGCFQNALPDRGRDRTRFAPAGFDARTGTSACRPTTAASRSARRCGGASRTEGEGLMCLAVPGKILDASRGDDPLMRIARVDFGGIVKEVSLAYVPEATVGDYVLVHVGLRHHRHRRGRGRRASSSISPRSATSRRSWGRGGGARMRFVDEYRDRDGRRGARRRHRPRHDPAVDAHGGLRRARPTPSSASASTSCCPPDVTLVHGPGCPVCVTPVEIIDKAIAIAGRPGVDLLLLRRHAARARHERRPARREGRAAADVRIVYSPLDALASRARTRDARWSSSPSGFETTAPANAMAVYQAKREGLRNFSLLVSHVLVPPAMRGDPRRRRRNRVQGFLAAGHVCTIMGFEEYEPIAAQLPRAHRGHRLRAARHPAGRAPVPSASSRRAAPRSRTSTRRRCRRRQRSRRRRSCARCSGW